MSDVSKERELAGTEVLVIDVDPAVQRGLEKLLTPRGLPVTSSGRRMRPARASSPFLAMHDAQ